MKKSMFAMMFTAFSIVANFYGSQFAGFIVFPLYLDSIMTMAATSTCGIIPGLICAVGTNFLLTWFSHASFLFVFCHIMTVLVSWLVFKKFSKDDSERTYSLDCFLWAGLFSAIINGVLGNIIAAGILSSISSRPQVDALVQGIFLVTKNLTLSTHFGGIIENLADKMTSAIISFMAYRIYISVGKMYRHK